MSEIYIKHENLMSDMKKDQETEKIELESEKAKLSQEIEEIIATLPRFVHKHTVIYRMYTTLKLYYLHQQELLNEVLSILKLHIHSADLAKTLMAYMATMRGGSFGWVAQITALLKTHLKMEVTQMQTLVAHHRLVYKLHSIIRHAAMRSHR